MNQLTRFACLLVFVIACGHNQTTPVNGACTDDADCQVGLTCGPSGVCQAPVECVDDVDCQQNGCTGLCNAGTCEFDQPCGADGTPSAELDAQLNSNGSLFGQAIYSDDAAFTDELAAQLAADDARAVGECIDLPQPTGGTPVTGQSMGNVQVKKGTTTLLDLAQEPNGSYEGFTAPGLVVFGDALDAAITGSAVVGAGAFAGVLTIPPAAPSITDPVTNGAVTLGTTIHYAPLAVDVMKMRFSFIGQNNQIVTIECWLDPAASSITLPQATFDRLPQNGTIFLEAFNRTISALDPADGVARSIVSTIHVSGSQGYTK